MLFVYNSRERRALVWLVCITDVFFSRFLSERGAPDTRLFRAPRPPRASLQKREKMTPDMQPMIW